MKYVINTKNKSVIDNTDKPVICVDFDETLCDSKYPLCGPPKEGAKEAMQSLRDMGYLILIYSCRTSHWHYNMFGGSKDVPVMERPAVINMKKWLHEQDIPYDEIDDGSKGKPFCDFIIDDKAVRYENNWPEIIKFIRDKTKRKPL